MLLRPQGSVSSVAQGDRVALGFVVDLDLLHDLTVLGDRALVFLRIRAGADRRRRQSGERQHCETLHIPSPGKVGRLIRPPTAAATSGPEKKALSANA